MTNNYQVPKFSIIIPTFNRALLLDRCLESLCSQTFSDFEVLVCDDGSSDNTISIVDSFRYRLNLSYFYQENWGGPARPRNIGLKNAKSQWVAFLDSDDYWSKDKLEVVNNYLDKGDVIYHQMQIVDENNKKLGSINSLSYKHHFNVSMLLKGNRIPLSSVVMKKKIALEEGGFTEERKLIAVEDFDLWLTLARKNKKFVFIGQSLGFYNVGMSNISSVSLQQVRRTRFLYLKHLQFIKEKNVKRSILGSYYYQKYKMLMLLKDKSSQGNFKRACLYGNVSTRLKLCALKILAFFDFTVI